jgi:hypothetical protein
MSDTTESTDTTEPAAATIDSPTPNSYVVGVSVTGDDNPPEATVHTPEEPEGDEGSEGGDEPEGEPAGQ